ncbi:MAG: threonylcarbamoyl-AMP synthase [Anaerolineae bacterium]|nr:threonylcarbamoyl-AMP synthase [Anaerolineae bacterium]
MRTTCVGARQEDIAQAVEVLRRGGLVVFPTDTVYGVGAHAMLPDAVAALYVAKRRARDKAIPLLVPSLEALPPVVAAIPDAARVLAERFWPGALTIVLRRAAGVPDVLTAGGETVAVRAPDHPVARALLDALAAPLAATSANLSGEDAPDTAAGALAQLDGRVALILDGGRCPGGVASTVIDLTVDPPVVLREGAIAAAALWQALRR